MPQSACWSKGSGSSSWVLIHSSQCFWMSASAPPEHWLPLKVMPSMQRDHTSPLCQCMALGRPSASPTM